MNDKRNLLTSVLLSTVIGAGAGAAGAVDYSPLVKQGFFGTPVQSRSDATIRLSNATRQIYVDHFATTKFENDKGQSFTWRFDSTMAMSAFPIKTIAPSGFDAGNTWVNVIHPSEHLAQ